MSLLGIATLKEKEHVVVSSYKVSRSSKLTNPTSRPMLKNTCKKLWMVGSR